MTKHVGMFEAKTNLSALVEEVEKGGSVVITRHGKPVAKLVRATPELTPEEIVQRRDAIAALRKLARELDIKATHEEIKSWINEGRH
ncbi:MAG: Prevent host death protein, Phd antitoxin [Pseudolabrys sp.]|jgi:prevent-host-death family protein|nr:Prevent host death protein, Phd antitoxin [Pseudolabrys sp.]